MFCPCKIPSTPTGSKWLLPSKDFQSKPKRMVHNQAIPVFKTFVSSTLLMQSEFFLPLSIFFPLPALPGTFIPHPPLCSCPGSMSPCPLGLTLSIFPWRGLPGAPTQVRSGWHTTHTTTQLCMNVLSFLLDLKLYEVKDPVSLCGRISQDCPSSPPTKDWTLSCEVKTTWPHSPSLDQDDMWPESIRSLLPKS